MERDRTDATWFDRVAAAIAPRWQLQRMKARVALGMLQRVYDYDAASSGRRTQNWRRSSTDANAAIGPSLGRLRDLARDLVRNNGYAESALTTITDNVVGWGLVPSVKHDLFNRWANSTDCDADGRNDLGGLQKLVVRTVVESGECLVRRRARLMTDGFVLPVQLQVLEPDLLDTSKQVPSLPNGGQIIQGVEFDPLGRRAAYWLFRQHPGSSLGTVNTLLAGSYRVPASEILHVFRVSRPGQVRAPSWFAPVLVAFREFDEYDDATLVKQKIAACLAVILTDDLEGAVGAAEPSAIGTADTSSTGELLDTLSPGLIAHMRSGEKAEVVQPPSTREYTDYVPAKLRSIATGLHVTYEDMTGDYTDLPFSAARMSRIRNWARVEDARWRMLVPQFLNPTWSWAMDAAAILGQPGPATTTWTAPPMPLIDPDKEGLAIMRNVRAGIQTLSDALRERGYIPEDVLQEMADDNKRLDTLGLVLDCDPRYMTQAGQAQTVAKSAGAGARSQGAARSDLDRLAEWLGTLPDEKVVAIFDRMFGERAAPRESENG